MKRLLFTTAKVLLVLVFLLAPKTEAAKDSGTAELVIFHTNDMHARVLPDDDNGNSIGFAEISAAVKSEKLKNPDTLWLDAGDTLHGMPRINISRGFNMVLLLNQSAVDAMSPGNHDYNYGYDQLQSLAKSLKLQVLSANTVKKGTKKNIFKPYKIYKLPNDIKVGVFGLTTPETAYKANPTKVEGVDFLNPIEVAQEMVNKLKPKCDVIIALMHMGLDGSSDFTSELIALEVPGIDLIVDGHSHTALPKGMNVGDTLIVQTGWHNYRLGKVKLNIKDHKIVDKQAQLLDSDAVKKLAPAPDIAIIKSLETIEERNEPLFNEVIAHSDRKLTSDRLIVRRHEAELGNLCADAFRWRTKADIAVINGGGLRSDLPKGNVTRGDIMAIFPFGNTVQLVEINGRSIREMLEHSVFAYPNSFGGFLHISGFSYSFDPTKPAGQRVVNVFVGNQPLDDNKIYRMASNDFLFVGGDDYDMLKGLSVIGKFETCEDVVADYLNKVGMSGIAIGRVNVLKDVPMPEELPDGELYETSKDAA